MCKQLEDYLVAVADELDALPSPQRDAELREIRNHLSEAVEARRQQGVDEEKAVQTTIAQFGSPEIVGEKIVAAWRRGAALRACYACVPFVCFYLVKFLLGRLSLALCTFGFAAVMRYLQAPFQKSFGLIGTHRISESDVITSMNGAALIWAGATAFLAGGICGILFPKKAVLAVGTISAVSILFRFCAHSVMLNDSSQPYNTIVVNPDWRWNWQNFAFSLAFSLVSMIGAWLGSRRRAGRAGIRLSAQ